MFQDFHADIALELARLTREACERTRNRMAARQLGEAFREVPQQRKEAPAC